MSRNPGYINTRTHATPDPRLLGALRALLTVGALLVVAVPAARGSSLWFGALPLWLLAMPLSSLWALRAVTRRH